MQEQDAGRYQIIVGGVPMSGFGPDQACSIEESGPRWVIVTGLDGQLTRSKDETITALCTIYLASSSKSNAVLSGLRELDLKTAGGAPFPILVLDGNGTSVFSCDTAWIEEFPKPSRGKQATVNEWKIRTDTSFKLFEGGT